MSAEQSDNLSLIIGLSVGLGLLLIIIIITIIIIIIIVVTCHRRRRSKPTEDLATAYQDNDAAAGVIELHEDDKYYSTISDALNNSGDNQYSRPLPVTPTEDTADHYSDLKLPTPEPTSDSEPSSPYYLTLQSEDAPVQATSLTVAEA